ncbi:MAG: CopG family transcriptional regulator [candidate division NC10 bacterium]|nr:CopG family transcriptional regulator [candidate division NC10 bacterium]
MSEPAKRSTVYFSPDLHQALRIKAADTQRTVSDPVNDAVRMALREDQEDLAAFAERQAEPVMTCEALLTVLKVRGTILLGLQKIGR